MLVNSQFVDYMNKNSYTKMTMQEKNHAKWCILACLISYPHFHTFIFINLYE